MKDEKWTKGETLVGKVRGVLVDKSVHFCVSPHPEHLIHNLNPDMFLDSTFQGAKLLVLSSKLQLWEVIEDALV